MSKQLERVQKQENRTRSELVREALRQYIESRYPAYSPTATELAAIRLGRAQIEKGNFVTLEQLVNELDATARKPRSKSSRKVPR